MDFYKDVKFESKANMVSAEQFLRDAFDWDAPKDTWKAAKISHMLKHFGKPADAGTCNIYGRAVKKLNGGMCKRYKGENLTWLPPLKG